MALQNHGSSQTNNEEEEEESLSHPSSLYLGKWIFAPKMPHGLQFIH